MNWFRSSKFKKNSPNQPSAFSLLLVASVVTFFSGLVALQQSRIVQPFSSGKKGGGKHSKNDGKATKISVLKKNVLAAHTGNGGKKPSPPPAPTMAPLPPPAQGNLAFAHTDIITTIFWVGEVASSDNGGISNTQSTWDESWKSSYGGTDNPNGRNGYLPSGFTPKENPFYIALPYSDLDDNGDRKASATNCPSYPQSKNSPHSWCKNSWIAIRHNGKIAYAQWQDAGPFGEDDLAYVFGSAKPSNTEGERAGLDVSPAVRDYFGLSDVDACDWTFVSAGSVPVGPWKQIVTTTPGTTVN